MKRRVITWLISKDAIAADDAELYEYAIDSITFMLVPLIVFIILGFIMGDVLSCILIIVPFLMIRRYAGGFHADNPVVCQTASTIILLMSYFIPLAVHNALVLILISVAGAAVVGVLSPIENKNKPLSDNDKRRNKIRTVVITLGWLCVEILMYIVGKEAYCINIATGILLVFVMQIMCFVHRR